MDFKGSGIASKFGQSQHQVTKRYNKVILVQYCRIDTTRKWLDTTRTTRTSREIMVYGLYRSWNNGLRIAQSDNCIHNDILMRSNII